jgi:hypothetical protein
MSHLFCGERPRGWADTSSWRLGNQTAAKPKRPKSRSRSFSNEQDPKTLQDEPHAIYRDLDVVMTRAFDRARSRKASANLEASPRRAKLVATLCAEALIGAVLLSHNGCTNVDPGPNFVVPDQTFDANYFFCHVEPEVLFAKKCGPGDPSAPDAVAADSNNGCHFNSSAVSGMALLDHPPVDCGGGDIPLDTTQIGSGSPAQGNLQAASLEMNVDYQLAAIYVRPTGTNHPRVVYQPTDPVVQIIQTWASK